MAEPENIHLMLLGSRATGKTSIRERLITGRFSPVFQNTLGLELGKRTIVHDNHTINLYIWDPSGQESFHAVASSFYRKADGFLLVYDVDDFQSYVDLSIFWIQQIRNFGPQDAELILLGNKSDKGPNVEVPSQLGSALASELNIPPSCFLETSAQSNTNLDSALARILTRVLEKEPRNGPRRQGQIHLVDADSEYVPDPSCFRRFLSWFMSWF